MMKTLIGLMAGVAVLGGAALAASTTVEFTSNAGRIEIWTFVDDGTARAPRGAPARYTWDEEAKRLCTVVRPDEDGADDRRTCYQFDSVIPGSPVGSASAYRTDDGQTGFAVVTAKSR